MPYAVRTLPAPLTFSLWAIALLFVLNACDPGPIAIIDHDAFQQPGVGGGDVVGRGVLADGLAAPFDAGSLDSLFSADGDKDAAAQPPSTSLQQVYGGEFDEEAFDLVAFADGGAVLAGTTASMGAGDVDALLIRTDACGARLWARAYGTAGFDDARGVVALAGGDLAVAGRTAGVGGDSDAWLMRTNATGTPKWSFRYGGPSDELAVDLAALAGGGVVAVGSTFSEGPGTPKHDNLLVLRVDDLGAVLWARTLGGTQNDSGFAVAAFKNSAGQNGGIVVAGASESAGAGNDDIWLISLEPDGNFLWSYVYGSPADDEARAVAFAPDGGFTVAGFTDGFGATLSDAFALHVNAIGHVQWFARYGGAKEERVYAVQPTPDGWAFAGRGDSFGGSDDGFLLVTNGKGTPTAWQDLGAGHGDKIAAIATNSGGALMLAGRNDSHGGGERDAWLVRTDAAGAVACDSEVIGDAFVHAFKAIPRTLYVPPSVAKVPTRSVAAMKVTTVPGNASWSASVCSAKGCEL